MEIALGRVDLVVVRQKRPESAGGQSMEGSRHHSAELVISPISDGGNWVSNLIQFIILIKFQKC